MGNSWGYKADMAKGEAQNIVLLGIATFQGLLDLAWPPLYTPSSKAKSAQISQAISSKSQAISTKRHRRRRRQTERRIMFLISRILTHPHATRILQCSLPSCSVFVQSWPIALELACVAMPNEYRTLCATATDTERSGNQ